MQGYQENEKDSREHTLVIEGRNAVLEALRSGKAIDKLFVLDGCQDGPVRTIIREAGKQDMILNFVGKERLNQLSVTGKHQGVIAYAAAYDYADVEDMLALAQEKGEPPFLILLDNIEDPYSQSGGSTWSHHTETQGGGADGDSCPNLCRCLELHSGGKSDKSGQDH